MLGSYFMSNGASVSQAAAGLGDAAYTQAAAGLGRLGAIAETARIVGQPFGESVNVYRDGIFSEGTPTQEYGEITNVFRDGIFAGSIQSGMGAAGATLDLHNPAVLKQVKMMLRAIDPNLPVPDMDIPWWTTETENSWHTAVYATAIKTNTPPATAGTWNQKVKGRDVPTTTGLYSVFGYAIQGVAPNYPDTYWPTLSAWIKAGGTELRPPALTESEVGGGLSTAKMIGFGAAAAGVVLAGLWFMKKRRGGSATL